MSKYKYRTSHPLAFRSLAFRLTLWYAGVFLVVAVLLFGGLYFLLYSLILNQTDQFLAERANTVSAILYNQGVRSSHEQAYGEARAAGERATFFRLMDERGQEFFATSAVTGPQLSLYPQEIHRLLESRQALYRTVTLDGYKYPLRVGFFAVGPSAILQIGQSLESSYQLLDLFRLIFLLGLTGAFILTVLLSAILAGNLLKMINNVTQTAVEIADASHPQLDRRVYVGNSHNEITEMARTFNTMLDRIQELVAGMEEMSDNMAHDLKSPVTRIRGLTEVTLMHDASVEEYQKMGEDIINECDNLLGMINNILFISKAKHGVYVPQFTDIDLNEMGEQTYQMFAALAESKGLTLNRSIGKQPLLILGDKRLLQRCIANLVDNAIKYTPAGGIIDIICMPRKKTAVLKVCDTGSGIPQDDLERVFERFYRSDVSRSSEGAGLGLSFVKAAIEAMYGAVTVESRLTQGSSFTLTFERYNKLGDIKARNDLLDKLMRQLDEE